MSEVFADTGYWLATIGTQDQHRESAFRAIGLLGSVHIVTTEMVLTEVFAAICRRGRDSRRLAIDLLNDIRRDPNVTVIPQTSEQFERAVEYFGSRLDQRFSLTDCASFQVMEDRGIHQALAHDADFLAAGFAPLMR